MAVEANDKGALAIDADLYVLWADAPDVAAIEFVRGHAPDFEAKMNSAMRDGAVSYGDCFVASIGAGPTGQPAWLAVIRAMENGEHRPPIAQLEQISHIHLLAARGRLSISRPPPGVADLIMERFDARHELTVFVQS